MQKMVSKNLRKSLRRMRQMQLKGLSGIILSAAVSVSSGSKHPREAWELVKHLSSVRTAQGLAELNMIPARMSVLKSAAFIKDKTPFKEEKIVEALADARAVPSLPHVEQLGSIWGRQIEAIMLGKATDKCYMLRHAGRAVQPLI
jgi:ABC-type glycerol-3-phosphate transport system substrate-binding protein